jgi:replicative DNA helicase
VAELDLGPTFAPEAEHLGGLLEQRDVMAKGGVPTGLCYLDDCLEGGVFPGDLLLWAAGTGVGKTALAVSTAEAALRAGLDNVYLFALEAHVGEISARLYFRELARRAKDKRLDFAGWWRGHWRHLDERHGEDVKAELAPLLARLRVFYKGRGDFTVRSLSQQLEAVADKAQMVILDHIHMVDEDERDKNESAAQKRTVQTLRDMALESRIPVCVTAHIRKKRAGDLPTLLPSIDDVHGSGFIAKIATQIILFGRDWDGPQPQRNLSPTLVQVHKDRIGRASTQAARIYFDTAEGRYESAYELGRIGWDKRKQVWSSVPMSQVPTWAKREARVLAAEQDLPL